MPTLKVRPLEWYMQEDPEDLAAQGYTELPAEFPLVERDGYYCCGNDVWFEYQGRGYRAYPRSQPGQARQYFCYTLKVNDEAILPDREVTAMRVVLNTCRDASVKKSIRERLNLHDQAVDLKSTGRRARLSRIQILGY